MNILNLIFSSLLRNICHINWMNIHPVLRCGELYTNIRTAVLISNGHWNKWISEIDNPSSTAIPGVCCFLRRWHPVVVSASSFTCAGSLHFIRQKNERRAPGQSRDTPCGTSVFTGNIAAYEPFITSLTKKHPGLM